MTTRTMVAEVVEPKTTVLVEADAAARYMVNAGGDKADVVLPLPIWEKRLER